MNLIIFISAFSFENMHMDISKIFTELLDKPDVPKYYRELQKNYISVKMLEEAAAIASLLERKFEKKNEIPVDDPSFN